jgi:hypothetical protein
MNLYSDSTGPAAQSIVSNVTLYNNYTAGKTLSDPWGQLLTQYFTNGTLVPSPNTFYVVLPWDDVSTPGMCSSW